tara:strand:- start:7703 stop:8398 length:696 start_codon:yes stop_codon:yes gene_type:complete
MSDELKDFIKDSSHKSVRNQKHFKIFGVIDFYIKDPLPENIDIVKVIAQVEEKIPFHITNEVDAFYVGNFKEFEEKQVNAMYRDGAIYVSSDQDNDADMIDDLIHELAHAAEEIHARHIYSDNLIQQEFLGKRKRLRDLIFQYGYLGDKDISFTELEYSKELDDFLYKELGYDKLETFCTGLFVRPYAATDIREYFATALEHYLLEDPVYLKKLSPIAYKKVAMICNTDEV